jgi:thiamine-phosphate pyrophosphorylase
MIVVISSPVPVVNEKATLLQLFDEGLELFHLRKKEYSESELRRFIEGMPAEHLKKTVLHSHYHLAAEYSLKGIHVPFAFKCGNPIGTVSVSFHSAEEIRTFDMQFDYGFLSPVFDSISKNGYKSSFDLNEVKFFLKHSEEKIIALGGMDEDKIETVHDLGFSGIALLGAIWQNESPVEKFKRIKQKWQRKAILY